MFIAVLLSCCLQKAKDSEGYIGFYENKEKDIRLYLNGAGYDLAVGQPLNIEIAKRHVNFEAGEAELAKQSLVLKRSFLFKSPSRTSYRNLTGGGMHKGYQVEFKTAKEQDKFLSELSWRVDKSPAVRKARLVKDKGHWTVLIDGVTLSKTNQKTLW